LTAFKQRLGKINEAIEKEDWFSGFANAVSYFEHYGYFAIRAYCARQKVELTKTAMKSLKDLSVGNIALLLRVLKLIDSKTYSGIKKIVKERNKLVHPARKGILYRDMKKKETAIRLLNQAKEDMCKIKDTIEVRKSKRENSDE
jgi:hypothetical protein